MNTSSTSTPSTRTSSSGMQASSSPSSTSIAENYPCSKSIKLPSAPSAVSSEPTKRRAKRQKTYAVSRITYSSNTTSSKKLKSSRANWRPSKKRSASSRTPKRFVTNSVVPPPLSKMMIVVPCLPSSTPYAQSRASAATTRLLSNGASDWRAHVLSSRTWPAR